MTMEKDSFEGLMSSLNLDADKFVDYKVHPDLNYQQMAIIKKSMEDQLTSLFDILANEFKADMHTPLLTADGFPRDDIDVVSVRLVRVKIIRLRNDHKYLLTLIEQKLADQFAGSASKDDTEPVEVSNQVQAQRPFARIDDVIQGSPAHGAGLLEGDKVVVFGGVDATNHSHLNAVVAKVQASVDTPVAVKVDRAGTAVDLQLTPTSNWGGRGLLGCKIVPL